MQMQARLSVTKYNSFFNYSNSVTLFDMLHAGGAGRATGGFFGLWGWGAAGGSCQRAAGGPGQRAAGGASQGVTRVDSPRPAPVIARGAPRTRTVRTARPPAILIYFYVIYKEWRFANFSNKYFQVVLLRQRALKGTVRPDWSVVSLDRPLTLIRMTKDEKGLAFFKGLLL